MDVNGLIDFHKGEFTTEAFKIDLLDMCLGFPGDEIEKLQSLPSQQEFIRHMNEEQRANRHRKGDNINN